MSRFVTRTVLEKLAISVRAAYGKAIDSEQDPKYHETRETLWEVGGTTPKAKYSLVTDSA